MPERLDNRCSYPPPCCCSPQDKFAQVNEFLKLLGHTGVVQELQQQVQQQQGQEQGPGGRKAGGQQEGGNGGGSGGVSPRPLHIVDCGCGSSHLSFGGSKE